MNLNTNNLAIGNFMMKVNFKTMIMGIIIATTFLVTSNNANGPATAFAQQPCVDVVNVTLSSFPKQTDDASSQVTLSPLRSHYEGAAQINIPGIGSGDVQVNLERSNDQILVHVPLTIISSTGEISSIGEASFNPSALQFCDSGDTINSKAILSGIGSGTVSITKVN